MHGPACKMYPLSKSKLWQFEKKKTCTNSIFVFKKMIDIRAGIELLGSEEKLLHDSNIPIYYTLNLQPKKESINE